MNLTLNKHVAELLGWTDIYYSSLVGWCGTRPKGIPDKIPDYSGDLNAIFEVVRPHFNDGQFWKTWTGFLKEFDPECDGWATTAAQRCEAFILTMEGGDK